ncbi:MAG: leucine-rich repeat domain-containing protein [Kiritimatiellae bacterium]|nr:leucine-rich repeat domain-containing protein [Kiritimatiellia bacterium]MDD5522939.1 leucine-rich repeat domain-containing protein [Kiritimatiellia bacterium]
MMKRLPIYCVCLLFVSPVILHADIHYVSPFGANNPPYTNWADAATAIQSAIDVAASNDTILVTNGVYETGGKAVQGTMTNRVVLTNAVRVLSVNGPEVTIIKGLWHPVTTNGDGAIRCVYVGTNCILAGFTLTNGATRAIEDMGYEAEVCGGGAFGAVGSMVSNCIFSCNSAITGGGAGTSGSIYNCLFLGNHAKRNAGGAFGGVFYNCIFSDNSSSSNTGAVAWNTLYNCILKNNFAYYSGGGAGLSKLHNCTIIGNSVAEYGGGVADCTLTNCIVYYNTAGIDSNNVYRSPATFTCTIPAIDGIGNITNDPQFVDMSMGNYHLSFGSPCIDAGTNLPEIVTDLEGNPRPLDGNGDRTNRYDMGCYEYNPQKTPFWITDFALSSTGTCYLSWTNVTFNYIVQRKTSLLTGTWQYAGTVLSTNDSVITNTFDNCSYRIRKVKVLNLSDTNFEKAVRIAITNKFLPTNELYDIDVNTITNLNVNSKGISNMVGIAEFINLNRLECFNNQLTNLDVAGCTNLNWLGCGLNQLTNLNVTGLIKLNNLYCKSNSLPDINVAGCTNLNWLDCSFNLLTNLTVSCTNLSWLYCNNNQLTNLNVTGCSNLSGLFCCENPLTNLDLSANTSISYIDARFCPLTNIIVWWIPPTNIPPTITFYYDGNPAFSNPP